MNLQMNIIKKICIRNNLDMHTGMHTGDSKEIVSHAYPGVAYKSYIYIGL